MQAVRAHIRWGAVTALLALALQLGLSFGHFHRVAVAPLAVAEIAVNAAAHGHPGPDGLLPDECDICATIALAGTALHAVPPVLPMPPALTPARAAAGERLAPRAASFTAFNPRAPPIA